MKPGEYFDNRRRSIDTAVPDARSGDPEAGGARALGTTLVIVAAATLLWTVFYYSNFTHIWAADAMKYAEAARNFLAGKGFVMGEVWPLHLASGYPVNAQVHAVLHPLVLAGLFAIAGQTDGVVAAGSGVFFILSAPLVYWLTKRLFGLAAAFAALALFLAEPWMLYYSVSGLTESLFIFLLLCVFMILAWAGRDGKLSGCLAAGFLLGLAHLTRPVGFAFVVPVALYACADSGRGLRRLVPAAAVILGFLAPVLISHAAVASLGEVAFERNSFHLLSQTPLHPGHAYVRTVVPLSFLDEFTARTGMYVLKWIRQLVQFQADFFSIMASPVVTALFLAFPLVWDRGGRQLRLYLLLLGFILVQAGLSIVTFHSSRYLHPFTPLALAFACGSLTQGTKRLLAGKGALRVVLMVLVIVWASYPFAYTAPLDRDGVISRDYKEIRYAKDYGALGEFIRQNTGDGDVMLCDAPWLAAWYGNRTAVWLPNSPKDVAALRELADIRWLLLTGEYSLPTQWQLLFERILEERRGEGWVFVTGFETGGAAGYLFKAIPPDSLDSKK